MFNARHLGYESNVFIFVRLLYKLCFGTLICATEVQYHCLNHRLLIGIEPDERIAASDD